MKQAGVASKPLIVPTVGRIVWYKHYDTPEPMVAIVCAVHGDDAINVSVFNAVGVAKALHYVLLYPGPWEDCPVGSCCWMPYQQNQAAKGLIENMKPAPTSGRMHVDDDLTNIGKPVGNTEQVTDLKNEMNIISKAMQADAEFAYSWHCNIAMACSDSFIDTAVASKVSVAEVHKLSNEAATRFMKLAFNVDTAYIPSR